MASSPAAILRSTPRGPQALCGQASWVGCGDESRASHWWSDARRDAALLPSTTTQVGQRKPYAMSLRRSTVCLTTELSHLDAALDRVPEVKRLLDLAREGDWRRLLTSPSTIHVSATDGHGTGCAHHHVCRLRVWDHDPWDGHLAEQFAWRDRAQPARLPRDRRGGALDFEHGTDGRSLGSMVRCSRSDRREQTVSQPRFWRPLSISPITTWILLQRFRPLGFMWKSPMTRDGGV